MRVKSPCRYPGGKSRAVKFLFDDRNLPSSIISEYREPFLGGGSCAFAFAQKYPTVPVWVNDKYYNLYCFWISLRDNCLELQEELYNRKSKAMQEDSHRELFNYAKESIESCDSMLERAWRFFVMNKCSFSGLGESSGFSAQASIQNFSEVGINRLIEFSRLMQGWKVTNLDYQELLTDTDENAFILLDPPYDIKSFLYGKDGDHHSNFDHYAFCEDMKKISCHAMITYNSNDKLKEMYKDWHQTEWDLTYTMHSSKKYREDEGNRKELLLTNYSGGMFT